jgi:indolepyruvate ferredoxin oxidoreductase alpha subunit
VKNLAFEVLLGNEAIARGLVENNCEVITSYPGTPSSEIIPEVARLKQTHHLPIYVEWSINEKVAFDIALGASYAAKRTAVAMKQVGLNVASDSLMSSAYSGVKGGFVIISCDDPGPHSSQTEQDSRYFAMFAKVPALDPANPQEAKDLLKYAFYISEKYETPVIYRPAIRVCHAKQNVRLGKIQIKPKPPDFQKNPNRWAATPHFRLFLHQVLNKKIDLIRSEFEKAVDLNYISTRWNKSKLGIIAGGVCFSIVKDILKQYHLENQVAILKITTAYPLPVRLVDNFIKRCAKVLVLEETDEVIETQIMDKTRILGRHNGIVPRAGELVPEVIYEILGKVLSQSGIKTRLPVLSGESQRVTTSLKLPVRKPTLCPGCPHRASFFAIRKAFPKAIYPSDIGCYTLGLNLGAVDTCLDMGGAVTLANGFYQVFKLANQPTPIIATIGDSTLYHAGIPALVNAVYTRARFILVILDNSITAMTGMQPTPGLGILADGSTGEKVPLGQVVSGCGVKFIRECDPYEIETMQALLKEAYHYTQQPEGGVAVIIASHPCPLYYRDDLKKYQVNVIVDEDACTGCKYCIKMFECPALVFNEARKKVKISSKLCSKCGVCIRVCPQGALIKEPQPS